MKTATRDDQFEQWLAAMPESKLELIKGKVIISTLAGSRWVLWALLDELIIDGFLARPVDPSALSP